MGASSGMHDLMQSTVKTLFTNLSIFAQFVQVMEVSFGEIMVWVTKMGFYAMGCGGIIATCGQC